jgi:hypothetical protein
VKSKSAVSHEFRTLDAGGEAIKIALTSRSSMSSTPSSPPARIISCVDSGEIAGIGTCGGVGVRKIVMSK